MRLLLVLTGLTARIRGEAPDDQPTKKFDGSRPVLARSRGGRLRDGRFALKGFKKGFARVSTGFFIGFY